MRIAITGLCLFAVSACTGPIVTTSDWSSYKSGELQGSYYLPQANFPLTVTVEKCELSFEIGAPVYAPDPAHHYVMHFEPDSFSADDVAFGADESGLLESAKATSDPQASAIIGKLIATVGDFQGIYGADLEGGKPAPFCEPKADPQKIVFSFAPGSEDSRNAIKGQLPPGITLLTSSIKPKGTQPSSIKPKGKETSSTKPNTNQPPEIHADCLEYPEAKDGKLPGLCYRIVQPFDIAMAFAVRLKTGSPKQYIFNTSVAAPDPERAFYVALKRDGLVKTDINVTFSHGLLTKYANVHPSTALAAISLPADILKSVIGLPAFSGAKSK